MLPIGTGGVILTQFKDTINLEDVYSCDIFGPGINQ